MFIFSEKHLCGNVDAVVQVLLFNSIDRQAAFDIALKRHIEDVGIDRVQYSHLGAAYILRAVKDSSDKWCPVVRCGYNGRLLWEGQRVFTDSDSALLMCIVHVRNAVNEALSLDSVEPLVPGANLYKRMAERRLLVARPYDKTEADGPPGVARPIVNACPVVSKLGTDDHMHGSMLLDHIQENASKNSDTST